MMPSIWPNAVSSENRIRICENAFGEMFQLARLSLNNRTGRGSGSATKYRYLDNKMRLDRADRLLITLLLGINNQ